MISFFVVKPGIVFRLLLSFKLSIPMQAYVILRCAAQEASGMKSAIEVMRVTMQSRQDNNHPFPCLGDLFPVLFAFIAQSSIASGRNSERAEEEVPHTWQPNEIAWKAISRYLSVPDLVRLSCTCRGLRWLDLSTHWQRSRLRRIATSTESSFMLMLDACTTLQDGSGTADAFGKIKASLLAGIREPWRIDAISHHLRDAVASLPDPPLGDTSKGMDAHAREITSEVVRLASLHVDTLAQVGGINEVDSLIGYIQVLGKRAKVSRLAAGTMQQAYVSSTAPFMAKSILFSR